MISRKVHILFLLVVIFLVAGCGSQDERTEFQKNYKEGHAALRLELDETKTREEIHQNQPFILAFTLFNEAGYDADDVRVSIENYDQTYLSFPITGERVSRLEANSPFNEEFGGRAEFTFEGRAHSLQGAERRTENYRVYVIYNSKIEFTPTVCIDISTHDVFTASCLKPNAPVATAGQGAPVSIAEMEYFPNFVTEPPAMEFRLKVANNGGGKVHRMRLGQARIGNNQMACEFRQVEKIGDSDVVFRQDRDEAEIVCTALIPNGLTFETPLFMELFYTYEFSEQGSLTLID